MLISELQELLEHFKQNLGDLEIQTWFYCNETHKLIRKDGVKLKPSCCDNAIKLIFSNGDEAC